MVDNKQEIEKLKKELKDMKEYHLSSWNTYGSELCVEDMIAKEKKLEKRIKKLQNEE